MPLLLEVSVAVSKMKALVPECCCLMVVLELSGCEVDCCCQDVCCVLS